MYTKKLTNNEIANIIISEMLAAIDENSLPWQMPWLSNAILNPPKNLSTGNAYKGVNVVSLAAIRQKRGFKSSFWLTFDQAKNLGGSVIYKQKSSAHVMFSKPCVIPVLDKNKQPMKDENGDPLTKTIHVFNISPVFNADQCTGLNIPAEVVPKMNNDNDIADAKRIVSNYKDAPQIDYGCEAASYNSFTDVVKMPDRNLFFSESEHYATLFHELSHSTGHKNRLDRIVGSPKYSVNYAVEECIAEFSTSILCAHAGIIQDTKKNSVAYIQSWREAFKANASRMIGAISKAEKSANYILGIKPE